MNCPRCNSEMIKAPACEMRCLKCGGLLDCTDIMTNGI